MEAHFSSGASKGHTYEGLRDRKGDSKKSDISELDDDEIEDIITKTSQLKLEKENSGGSVELGRMFRHVIAPLFLTALSAYVRLYRIDANNSVVWDEAHFGKFGSYYLKREVYFDVHPPLGKLLVGLSGYLSDYDGSFGFESGTAYPEECNFVLMRAINCLFGIMCTPLAYKTAIALGFSQWTVYFISFSVIFEMISLTLSKFILLDSFLLFFTVLSFHFLVKIHNLRVQDKLLTFDGIKHLFLTGISVGCVCSVKWVGVFITAVIGFYTIYDLLIQTYQLFSKNHRVTTYRYVMNWFVRIVTLIFVPFSIYLLSFKVHFMILNHSGTGDGSLSTLFQASLVDSSIVQGPRSVAYGSLVTLRSQGLSPNLLHSHPHSYPEGSTQQQITTYGFKDSNNDFLIELSYEDGLEGRFATFTESRNNTVPRTQILKDGDIVRLIHTETGCLLHSHDIPAHISKSHKEVSCYASIEGSDSKDNWILEIRDQDISPSEYFHNENDNELHPISTSFRLRHQYLGCYLTTTGYTYPSWGFSQGEVTCKYTLFANDKSTWWNVEDHMNKELEMPPIDYVPPKPRFWKEFVLLNYNMMTSNNALVPDPDKFDRLSSEWWEWPILHIGLRMCGWGSNEVKYFLIGHPFITWFSTFSLAVFGIYVVVGIWRWQRQKFTYQGGIFDPSFNRIIAQGILPFLGWVFHYIPFIVMGRVTYIHHYVPALYFAILVSGFVLENLVYRHFNSYLAASIYLTIYMVIFYGFWHLRDLSFGMEGPASNYRHLRVLDTWMI